MAEFDEISSYINEAELKKETNIFIGLLKQIEDAAEGVTSKLKGINLKIDSKGSGIKDYYTQTEKAQKASKSFENVLKTLVGSITKLNNEQKLQLNTQIALFKQEKANEASTKAVIDLMKTEATQLAKLETGRTALALTLAKNNIQLKQEKLERDRVALVINSENNSRQKAQAIIDLLINKGKKLNLSTEQGRRVNDAYNATIQKQNEFLLQNSDVETKRIKNIGNYQGSAKIIVDAFEKLKTKTIEVEKEFGKLSPEGANIRAQFEGLRKVVESEKFLNISSKVGDTTAELRFFTKELNRLEDAGLRNSQVYIDIQNRLAKLTDQLGDTRAEIKALSSDTRGFDLFAGSVELAADTFQTVAGAAVLFGASEEDAAKATATLTAIMSVSNGVKGIANQLTTKGTAANKIYAAVQGVVSVATDKSAASTVRFAAASKLLLGVGVIFLLFQVAKAMGAFGDETEKTKKQQEDLTKSLEAQNEVLEQSINKIEDYGKRRENALKRGGASESALSQNALNTIKEQGAAYVQEFDNLEKRRLEYVSTQNKLLELANRAPSGASGALRDQASNFTSLANQVQQQQFLINDKINGLNKSADDIQTEIVVSGNKKREDVRNENAKKVEDALKAANEAAKEAAEKRLQQDIENENKKNNLLFEIEKARIESQNRILENEDTNNNVELQVSNLKLISDNKKRIAELEFTNAIANEKTVENGKLVIVKKTAEEKLLAEINYNARVREINDELVRENKNAYDRDLENKKEASRLKFESEVSSLNRISGDVDIERARAKNAALNALSAEAFEIESARIEKEFELKAAADNFNRLLSASQIAQANGQNDELLNINKELTFAEIELSRLSREARINDDKAVFENKRKIEDVKKEILKESEKLFINIIQGQFDREKNAIQENINLVETQKAARIDAITNSVASEEEKAAKIKIIEANAQAEKEKLIQKQKQIDYEKAVFDRRVAITEITINTIRAASKAGFLTPLGIGELALGAIKLASVLAKPIPKYRSGKNKNDNYEGPAIWGEEREEVKVSKDGSIEVSPNKATLTSVKKDDVIYPSIESFKKQNAFPGLSSKSFNDNKILNSLNNGFDKLGKIITNNKSITNVNIDPYSISVLEQTVSARTNYINKNVRFKINQ